MYTDFNREMEIIEEINKEVDDWAKRRLETIELFLELQNSLGSIKPIIKSKWEIEEENRKKQEKEYLKQLQKNSYFENLHLKKEIKKNGMASSNSNSRKYSRRNAIK